MPCSPEAASRAAPRWSVAGPAGLVDALAPLGDEWRRRGAIVQVHRLASGEDLRDLLDRLLGEHAEASDAGSECPLLMVLEEPTLPSLRARVASTPRGSASTALPGWLRMNATALAAYAARAVAILQRGCEGPAPLVLLGPREARYQAALDEVEACAAKAAGNLKLLRWSAERIRKPPLLNALRLGAAAALYMGHGNRHGWLAYGGLSSDDFLVQTEPWTPDETTSLFFALSCGGAGPEGIADALVAGGVAGAVLAPIGDPPHADNKRLAQALVEALAHGHRTLPSLLEVVRAPMAIDGAGYIVIGDPGLGALAAPGALARGLGVFAPAPDAVLVPADTR